MLALFFVPFGFLVSGTVESLGVYLLLWVVMGFGTAGIGVNIMHDANHQSLSRKKWVNRLAGWVMNLLGGDATIWRIQHNVLHHSFTNIHESDEDIIGPPLLRFSPHDRYKKVHRYQYIYAWFLYGLMTIIKVAYTDYKRAIRYYKMGHIKSKKEFRSRLWKISLGKVIYLSYILFLPMLIAPHWSWVILGFFIMHFLTGFLLSIIFQTAHVVPSSSYPLPVDGKIENNWAVHQLQTTSNFSPRSKWFSWLIGGLNYQVEHHLFAHINHLHYPKIAAIVSETAKEFQIPYHCQPTFWSALRAHGKMLYQLGRN